jgi:hypothetical protein
MNPITSLIEARQEAFIEEGADLEHDRWAHWQKYMHSKFDQESRNGEWICLPVSLFDRWERQITTKYADLSEQEKESDRKEVRKYLPLLTQTIRQILEAQCALMEGRKKEQGQFEPFVCEDNFEVNAYNSALSEIIASNRELLKTLQP